MLFSQLVAYCIILSAAAVLHDHGKTDIKTAADAAHALAPLAGQIAFVFFAAGLIGTGLLAIPVLSASAAYAINEAALIPAADFSYDSRHHRISCTARREVHLPYRYLGADDRAGPNYTGQPAVNSHYTEIDPAPPQRHPPGSAQANGKGANRLRD